MTAAPPVFDVCGPLPTGTTVLEASAGTGKTYTVAALVTRFVAEGHALLDELLVVTFGRAASQELRERVREALVRAERGLSHPGAARSGDDALLGLLARGPDSAVAERRGRLATALADFDAATIATTHQFCHQVLAGLGVAGDTEAGTRLVEDLDDLVTEVVDDLYVRGFAAPGAGPPPFGRELALTLGRAAVGDPQARLEPVAEDGSGPAGVRRRFAAGVRREVERRMRRAGTLGYDDLLSRLAEALADEEAPARHRMRQRWRIVLVDEFQDTDPVQWAVLERAFHGHATLVLIGDPKQAIYAFRGGDVVAYLAAAARAGTRSTLARNYRSDSPLVEALGVLMGGAQLGDPRIAVREVAASHRGSRLRGAPRPAPLRLRVVRRDQLGRGASLPPVSRVRGLVARDLAVDVARLLTSGATFDAGPGGARPLAAGDVAVLVSTHAQAALVRGALAEAGVPAVVAGGGSVFATAAADDWLVLLEALEQPHRSGRVRAAALTDFLGRTATGLAEAGDTLTDDLGALLRRWADLLASRGVAALLEVASAEQNLPARLLARTGGERRLTDLRHVGQALHAAAVEEGLGLAALVEWLRRRRDEAGTDSSAERTRRLDSDAAAVQVVTLHASKGLQYPVVLLPFASDRWEREPDMLRLHDDAGARVLDVGGAVSAGRRDRERQARAEDDGESLRLLYVGLTRAQSQVVLWWAPSRNTSTSALHRLLVARAPGTPEVPASAPLLPDDALAQRLDALARRAAPGTFSVEAAEPEPLPDRLPETAEAAPLQVARFDRALDTAWRRTSYSALAAAADAHGGGHGGGPSGSGGSGGSAVVDAAGPGVGSEPETGEREDERVPELAEVAGGQDSGSGAVSAAALLAVPSPMADLPSGTAFGTLVHAVLETADPQAGDLRAELVEHSGEQLRRRPLGVTPDVLAEALLPVLSTSLGPLADGVTLADVGRADRLAELDFELPLAGGDRTPWGGPAVGRRGPTLGSLAPLLRRHLPAGDPLAGYHRRLASPGMAPQQLRGYLSGSLDLVLRLRGSAGPRYVVADYKTNWLGDPAGPPLSAWHYRPAALDAVMVGSDYPLQALLYCVALHRFLRWRQPGYDPAVHLGGVLYLYVRGMCGPATPLVDGHPCGVFAWSPPAALVHGLSDLLDEGVR